MGPVSGATATEYVDGPPIVRWVDHRKVSIRRIIPTRHAHCRNGWRCEGPGCSLHTGKTAKANAVYMARWRR